MDGRGCEEELSRVEDGSLEAWLESFFVVPPEGEASGLEESLLEGLGLDDGELDDGELDDGELDDGELDDGELDGLEFGGLEFAPFEDEVPFGDGEFCGLGLDDPGPGEPGFDVDEGLPEEEGWSDEEGA